MTAPRAIIIHTTLSSTTISTLPVMDPFQVLGLTRGSCTEADVKKAYKKLALEVHPDKAGSSSEDRMKAVNAAYEKIIEGKLWETSQFYWDAPPPNARPSRPATKPFNKDFADRADIRSKFKPASRRKSYQDDLKDYKAYRQRSDPKPAPLGPPFTTLRGYVKHLQEFARNETKSDSRHPRSYGAKLVSKLEENLADLALMNKRKVPCARKIAIAIATVLNLIKQIKIYDAGTESLLQADYISDTWTYIYAMEQSRAIGGKSTEIPSWYSSILKPIRETWIAKDCFGRDFVIDWARKDQAEHRTNARS